MNLNKFNFLILAYCAGLLEGQGIGPGNHVHCHQFLGVRTEFFKQYVCFEFNPYVLFCNRVFTRDKSFYYGGHHVMSAIPLS